MNKHSSAYKPIVKAFYFLLGTIVFIRLLSGAEVFVNQIYPTFYAWFYPFYTQIFGWLPFSLGDVIYILLFLYISFNIYSIIKCFLFHQKWRAFRFISKLIFSVSILILLFHLLWGFNYHRKSLLMSNDEYAYKTQDLKKLAQIFLTNCQTIRPEVEEDKEGVFLYKKNQFLKDTPATLQESASLPFYKIPNQSKKKWSMFSVFMRYAGVSGYYNPFTAEAQLTRATPDTSLPFTLAHEQAHQMGYAAEYEANFIGFLTCYESNEISLQYSANYKAMKYILREIYPKDSVFVNKTFNAFTPGMKRDYEAEKRFHLKYSGRTNEIFSSMNHLYLKSNQQEKGIQSYNQFVDLIMQYHFQNPQAFE